MQEMNRKQVQELYAEIRDAQNIICCPYCGTGKVKEYRKHSQHCSGQWNTSTQFECGAQFAYSPNLICVEQIYMCQQSPEWKARIKKVDEMRPKIYEFAVANGVHELDLKKLKDKLEGWNPRYF